MISCLTFQKKLNDFIYGSITDDLRKSLEEHVQSCESCRMIYEEELQIEKVFKDVINIRNIKFTSSRDEILKNIDKSRYSKSLSNKLFYKIRKNIITYAASILLLVSITSGGFYLYNVYINPPDKMPVQGNDYNYAGTIKEDYLNKTSEPKTQDIKSNFIEKELPLPKASDIKDVQEVLDKMKNESLGVSPWIFGYADDNKIIFYNHSALLAYSYNNGKPQYYAGIDLQKIDAGYIQGSINTVFNFSPNGDYVVINNGMGEYDFQNNKYNMYLYNFKNRDIKIISNENKFLLKDTWSSTSNYYAFGDINGERIFIYDITSNTSITKPFNKGIITNIFISDYGDIIVESSSDTSNPTPTEKYILKKDNSYEPEEYFIPGIIIGIKGNKVLYYDQDTIYELVSGKSNPVKKLGAGFNILKLEKKYAVFTDGIYTYIYDYNNSFYRYMTSFSQDYDFEFSPDLKKSAQHILNYTKIINSEDNPYETEIGNYDGFSSSYTWFGNNSLIRIAQRNGSNKLGDFVLYKANILPETKKISAVYNDNTKINEQYAPGIFIDNPNINIIEKANFIFSNYLEVLKSENAPKSLRIKEYKIKTIKIQKQTDNSIIFSVEYSVLPSENYIPSGEKTKDDSGWYNNIFNNISVYSKNNVYYIQDIS